MEYGYRGSQMFSLPTRVIMGLGCRYLLGQEARKYGQSALVFCTKSVAEQPEIFQSILQSLEMAEISVRLIVKCHGEPTIEQVESGCADARSLGIEVVIGIGGGSVIDLAKAVAGLAPLSGAVVDYHQGKEVEGVGLPWIAVPTTAGSGAEVTPNAVISDTRRQVKASIRSAHWFARVALIDPELTLEVPPEVTASCGSDALCHAIEAYVSIGASVITDALAGEAIRRIGRSLVGVFENGYDILARSEMLYGSLLAGMALANARLGAVHGLAHPIGVRYNIPHGIICGILLPYVMVYNLPWAEEKYAQIAEWLGEDTSSLLLAEAASRAVLRVREMIDQLKLPTRLRDVGVPREDFPFIIEWSLPSGSLKHNPRPLDARDLERILNEAW